MTHSSVMPVDFCGERMLVYCANRGVLGVSAKDGCRLWESNEWKISLATVPSPLALGDGKLFLSGGYNAGGMLLEVSKSGETFGAKGLFRLTAEVFGATQHTPILQDGYLYGVRADGKFVCLSAEGKPVWASDVDFGLGGFLLADGIIYALNDSGTLRMIEAKPDRYHLLAQAQVLKGRESWGPPAIAGGRLLVRDLTKLVCLDVSRH
jgi:outer membrane protein assembly factor BamB